MRSAHIAIRNSESNETDAWSVDRVRASERLTGGLRAAVAAASLLAVVSAGCSAATSLSDSSGSIAGSVSGISDSTSNSISRSSASSRKGGEDTTSEAFQRDVTAYTAVFVESGASRGSFVSDLTRIAADHGISEWWADPGTYRAIGLGLKRGGLDEEGVSRFANDVFGGNERATEELLEGHRS